MYLHRTFASLAETRIISFCLLCLPTKLATRPTHFTAFELQNSSIDAFEQGQNCQYLDVEALKLRKNRSGKKKKKKKKKRLNLERSSSLVREIVEWKEEEENGAK